MKSLLLCEVHSSLIYTLCKILNDRFLVSLSTALDPCTLELTSSFRHTTHFAADPLCMQFCNHQTIDLLNSSATHYNLAVVQLREHEEEQVLTIAMLLYCYKSSLHCMLELILNKPQPYVRESTIFSAFVNEFHTHKIY